MDHVGRMGRMTGAGVAHVGVAGGLAMGGRTAHDAGTLASEPDPGTAGGILVVDTDTFQGPLDLLLHLVRTQDVDIFDIPIASITQQFLEAIEGVAARGIDEAGEFLEMAATLVRIKARLLLPLPPGEDEDEDPRAELVRRLLEYEQVREIAQRFRTAENDRRRRFAKGYVPLRPKPALSSAPLATTWDDLHAAALGVEPPEKRGVERRLGARPVAMRGKVDLILQTLRRVRRIEFRSLVAPWKKRMHGVMTLLAGLELGRRQVVSLRQRKPFSPLWMYPGREMKEGMQAAGFGDLGDGYGESGEGASERGPSRPDARARTAGGAGEPGLLAGGAP